MGFVVFLVAFVALSVLATVLFALGASIGYRNGTDDFLRAAQEQASRPRLGMCTDALSSRRSRNSRRSWHGAPLTGATGGRRRTAIRVDLAPNDPSPSAPPTWGSLLAGDTGFDPIPYARTAQAGVALTRRRRRVRIAAALLATALFAGPSTVALAANSVPGGALWRAKRSSEDVRLAFTQEPTERVRLHLRFASRRLSELTELMIHDADPEVVQVVSADLARHVRGAAEGVQRIPASSEPEASLLVVESARHLNRQVSVLEDLADIRCEPASSRSEPCADLEETLAASAAAVASAFPAPASMSVTPASEALRPLSRGPGDVPGASTGETSTDPAQPQGAGNATNGRSDSRPDGRLGSGTTPAPPAPNGGPDVARPSVMPATGDTPDRDTSSGQDPAEPPIPAEVPQGTVDPAPGAIRGSGAGGDSPDSPGRKQQTKTPPPEEPGHRQEQDGSPGQRQENGDTESERARRGPPEEARFGGQSSLPGDEGAAPGEDVEPTAPLAAASEDAIAGEAATAGQATAAIGATTGAQEEDHQEP